MFACCSLSISIELPFHILHSQAFFSCSALGPNKYFPPSRTFSCTLLSMPGANCHEAFGLLHIACQLAIPKCQISRIALASRYTTTYKLNATQRSAYIEHEREREQKQKEYNIGEKKNSLIQIHNSKYSIHSN